MSYAKLSIKVGDVVEAYSYDNKSPKKTNIVFIYRVDGKGKTAQALKTRKTNIIDKRMLKLNPRDVVNGNLEENLFIEIDDVISIPISSIKKRVCSIRDGKIDEVLRLMAYGIVDSYFSVFHEEKRFIPGKTYIPYSGRVFDSKEIKSLIDSSLDFWLTAGRFAREFEKEFSRFLGKSHCILTNSGSSANLLALSALTSPKLSVKRLKPGDEVITTACAFPTTVNPIIQNNLIPVFLDVDLNGMYNILADRIEEAITEKSRVIFIAHTLGNPFDLDKVMSIAKKHDLWLIEDNCDALGSKYRNKFTGTFGDMSTYSFYPPHHITMGEGGAVITNDLKLKRLVESFRDWGRDCWCEPGHDDTCGKRFSWKLGSLPHGYDHKYIYSHIGYNLKLTEMQAAIGLAQLKKLPEFSESRKRNWNMIYEGLKKYKGSFILPKPTEKSEPNWFGFLITVKDEAPFTRNDITEYLERNKIATRLLFSGNIIRHPGYKDIKYRVHRDLKNTDFIMNNTFWIGVYPGLTEDMINYMVEKISSFIEGGGPSNEK